MGPLKLDDKLEPGQFRELTEEEITLLKTIEV
jgi:16S rRNA U516 pseudouridylate synthase RsuA-like enzyme